MPASLSAEPVRTPLDEFETLMECLLSASMDLKSTRREHFEVAERNWWAAASRWMHAEDDISRELKQWFRKQLPSSLLHAADTSIRAATEAMTSFSHCRPPERQWRIERRNGETVEVSDYHDPKGGEVVQGRLLAGDVAFNAVHSVLKYREWAISQDGKDDDRDDKKKTPRSRKGVGGRLRKVYPWTARLSMVLRRDEWASWVQQYKNRKLDYEKLAKAVNQGSSEALATADEIREYFLRRDGEMLIRLAVEKLKPR